MTRDASNIDTEIYDVLIVGGGLVGASLAVALKPLGLKVGLIEAYQFGVAEQPGYDDRAIALSYGSSRIFSGMKLWQKLRPDTTAINQIHVSDRSHFGVARLTAQQEKVPALGYLVESRLLGKCLQESLLSKNEADSKALNVIDMLVPAKVIQLEEKASSLKVSIEQNGLQKDIHTRLLVGADGANSTVRQLLGIGVKTSDYHQVAVIANVTPQKHHDNQAFERFTETGPIALLPMTEGRCSLVWTHEAASNTDIATEKSRSRQDDAQATMALDDNAFLHKLNQAFGFRLGRFTKVGKRSAFPLSLVQAERLHSARVAIIGNAAHTLHPVAGQGFNLALRDIAVLTDLIADYKNEYADIGSDALLDAFEKQRSGDLKTTVQYTDSLVKLFSNNNFFLGHARAGGLLAVDRIAPLRRWLARKSMGINYRQSRLARGLSLRVD